MRIFLITILLFAFLASKADEKRALRLLQKRDFDKLVELLEKEIDKDSLNPGVFYIYSLLYNEPLFQNHNLDTAYQYILLSQSMIKAIEERDLLKLEKLGINDSTIIIQKQRLEYQGYERAKTTHTIEGYNYYTNYFSTSTYKNEALQDRNALAFQHAQNENTYQSYFQFMQEYPDSRQFEKAKENYDKLLFEEQIEDGTLKSYENFIIKYPESPFISRAVLNIYNIRTSINKEESLIDFIREFPNSSLVSDAMDRLYYNYVSKGDTDFTYNYSFLKLNDSIKYIDQYRNDVLIPVFENNKYGFITGKGVLIVPNAYDDLEISYLCGNIQEDYLIVKKDTKSIILSRTGEVIYDGDFYNVEDLGYGLLRISYNAKYGLIYKTGKKIFPIQYDEIRRLDDQLLIVRQNRDWRFYSLNGLLLYNDFFEDIKKEGRFILLKKDSRWAITTNERIFSSFIEGNGDFTFLYDDYELIESTQILCFKDDKETVIDKNLEVKIPLDIQNIYTLPEGWLVRKNNLYHIYDDAFFKISGSGFDKIEYKGNWLAGKTEGKWILYHNFAPFPDVFVYDSINILSDQFVLAFEEESSFLIFTNFKKQILQTYDNIKILQHIVKNELEMDPAEFLMIEQPKGKKSLYNKEGAEIIKGDFENIQAIGPEYLIIYRRGKVGLIDTTGRILLKPQYDAIANYTDGFVSVLNQKKFGLYNMHRNLFVLPRYDRLIKAYNQFNLIVHDSQGFGLIDLKRNEITDMVFEDITYWNDTVMLAKAEGLWHMYDLVNHSYILEGILDFEYLKDDGEKLIIYNKNNLYGAASNVHGIIINHTFNDIINVGSGEQPIYFAEKYIPEAEFYIVIYYSEAGEILRKQVFDDEEYEKIYCN